MDVLIAEWPNGSLAASTFDMPAGYGEQFRASFEARGFTVTRMTANARRAQLEQGRRQMREVREHPVNHPVTVSTEVVVVVSEGDGLPSVGQPVRHLAGRGCYRKGSGRCWELRTRRNTAI